VHDEKATGQGMIFRLLYTRICRQTAVFFCEIIKLIYQYLAQMYMNAVGQACLNILKELSGNTATSETAVLKDTIVVSDIMFIGKDV